MVKPACLSLVLTLFFTFSPVSASSEKTEGISTRSAVIFNTLCSKCHEGECSGRLSFDTGSRTAGSHIKRYTGDSNLSKTKIKEFFTLLNYMKKECAIYMPDTGKWKPEDLSRFMLPSSKGYFIPLGLLESGTYRMEVKSKEDTHFQVEILSDHFDHFLNQDVCPEKKNNAFQFTIDKPSTVFVRIKSRHPLHIVSLMVKKEK